jgi:hypothetical protein
MGGISTRSPFLFQDDFRDFQRLALIKSFCSRPARNLRLDDPAHAVQRPKTPM